MDEELRQQIQGLLDRQAIHDCLLRYTRGVDRVDEALIRSAFHADALDFHGKSSAGSIDGFLAHWLPQQPSRESAQHYVTNTTVELDPDGVTAHVETYFFFVVKHLDGTLLRLSGGRYADRFEKRDGDWRIALRIVLSEWKGDADGSSMALLAGHALGLGRRDTTDPVYQRPLRAPDLAPQPGAH